MKRIVCEMCGSQDMVKQDGYYVCMSCDTKYSVEEARKMMVEVEGKVDVSGSTVKVDYSSLVERSLANARRAMEKHDWEETERYYNMVEQYEPHNIEAIFYSAYGKAMQTMVESDPYKRAQKLDVLRRSISIIDDNYDNAPEKYEENKRMICKMSNDLMALMGEKFVYNTQKHSTGGGFIGNLWIPSMTYETNDSAKTYTAFVNVALGFLESINNIIKIVGGGKNTPETCYLYQIMKAHSTYVYMHCAPRARAGWLSEMKRLDSIIYSIQMLDPAFRQQMQRQRNRQEVERIQRENSKKDTIYAVLFVIGIIAVIAFVILMLHARA